MQNTMNIVEYCNQQNIRWQPIQLHIADGRKTPGKYGFRVGNEFVEPKNNDSKNISRSEFKRRQQLFEDSEFIAVHTGIVDVDRPGILQDIDSPYYNSVTKKLPRYFVQWENARNATRPIKGGDLICTSWAFARRDAAVHDSNRARPLLNVTQFEKHEVTKKGLDSLLKKLDPSDSFEGWSRDCYAIFNAAYENMLADPTQIVHEFSKRCPEKYDDDAVKFVDSLIYRKDGLSLARLRRRAKSERNVDDHDELNSWEEIAGKILEAHRDKVVVTPQGIYLKFSGCWNPDSSATNYDPWFVGQKWYYKDGQRIKRAKDPSHWTVLTRAIRSQLKSWPVDRSFLDKLDRNVQPAVSKNGIFSKGFNVPSFIPRVASVLW